MVFWFPPTRLFTLFTVLVCPPTILLVAPTCTLLLIPTVKVPDPATVLSAPVATLSFPLTWFLAPDTLDRCPHTLLVLPETTLSVPATEFPVPMSTLASTRLTFTKVPTRLRRMAVLICFVIITFPTLFEFDIIFPFCINTSLYCLKFLFI